MGEDKVRRCACGCGRDFVPVRKWNKYATPKCRWEAWILDKSAEIKRARKAAALAR